MAPEMRRGDGERIGIAADVYALGCVLYALLLGEAPGNDTEAVFDTNAEEKIRERFPSPRLRRMAAQAFGLAKQALATSPEQRQPTALHFAGALALIAARNEQPRVSGWRRAGRWAFMAVGWVAAAALAWPLYSVWSKQRAEARQAAMIDAWTEEDAVQMDYFAEVQAWSKGAREFRDRRENLDESDRPDREALIALYRDAEKAVLEFAAPAQRLGTTIQAMGMQGFGQAVDGAENARPRDIELGKEAREIANALARAMRAAPKTPPEETLRAYDAQIEALVDLIKRCHALTGARPERLVRHLEESALQLSRQREFVADYAVARERMRRIARAALDAP